jgi:flavin-dependent dehydrogenase
VVLEKGGFARDKPCGEGIMPNGVRLLDRLGVLARIPAAEQHVIRGVRFVIGCGASVQGDFPDVGGGFHIGIGVRRLVLDDLLLRHAQAHPNVDVHTREAATDVRRVARGAIDILTQGHCYRARIVVGADGLRSLVRSRLRMGLVRGRRQRFGLRTHYELPPGTPLDDYVSVHQHPSGQWFTTPVGESLLQVTLLAEKADMKPFAGRVEQAFDERLASQRELGATLAGARRISPLLACGPFDAWPRRRVADRAVLVGDAGGYLDPLTGEGISLALQGAVWAAEVLDESLRCDELSAARLSAYDRRLTRAMRHYKWLTYALLALSRHPRLAEWVVGKLARCPELYTQLLGVNCGIVRLWNLRAVNCWRFLLAH